MTAHFAVYGLTHVTYKKYQHGQVIFFFTFLFKKLQQKPVLQKNSIHNFINTFEDIAPTVYILSVSKDICEFN